MGAMIDGVWHSEPGAETSGGAFQRPPTKFRGTIEAGGRHPPAAGRYRLYVSLACPWAHRTLIFRKLKGLEAMIDVSVVHWLMGGDGWTFEPGEGVVPDPDGARFLREVYLRADAHYTGKVTVPALWDTVEKTIVNNESAEIIRILNAAFDDLGAKPGDYYPQALRGEIDALNARIYDAVNNGVYRAGFARSQEAYDEAVTALFDTLDWLEGLLGERTHLCGETITEADWRLFTTLVRFDAAYHGHFKCNIRRLVDYPSLTRYMHRLLSVAGVAETVDLGHIKRHYYLSHPWLDPTGIVPAGPANGLPRRR